MLKDLFKGVPDAKRNAFLFSVALFFCALIVTSIHLTPKSLKVEIKERNSINEESQVKTLTGVNPLMRIEDVLKENGIDTRKEYSADQDLDKKAINVDNITLSKNIEGTIKIEGELLFYESGAETVGDLLKELDIVILDHDTIVPSAQTPLTLESSEVTIHRTRTEREENVEKIPFVVSRSVDSTLPDGSTVIDVHGAEGEKTVVEDVLYSDGEVIQKNLVSEKVLKEPVNQIERVSEDIGRELNLVSAAQTVNPATPQTNSSASGGQTDNISAATESAQNTTSTPQTQQTQNSTDDNAIANATTDSNGIVDLISLDSYARPVNSANPVPASYIPTDLVSMNYGDSKLRKDAANAFNKMANALKNETGQDLLPLSCYRSYATQQQLAGNPGTASAGYSEHQLGLAVDVGVEGAMNIQTEDHFENTPAYAWLFQHAHEYGFCNSYPANTNFSCGFEPWHWRFLGADLAAAVRQAQINHTAIQYDDWVADHPSFILR